MWQQSCVNVWASVLTREAMPPPIAATCDLTPVVVPYLYPIGPLCFKYRIARPLLPLLSMLAGYWKRPLSGSWVLLAIGEQWLCCSKLPYHLSPFILINNSQASDWWHSYKGLFCSKKFHLETRSKRQEISWSLFHFPPECIYCCIQ